MSSWVTSVQNLQTVCAQGHNTSAVLWVWVLQGRKQGSAQEESLEGIRWKGGRKTDAEVLQGIQQAPKYEN